MTIVFCDKYGEKTYSIGLSLWLLVSHNIYINTLIVYPTISQLYIHRNASKSVNPY